LAFSTAIDHLHQHGVIHKDIKPANVLVNSTSGQCWLMGFGIASRLPRERQSPEPPEFIAGTLAYMAPEQTGRMNRSIDSRSDLYALGVTLYEMLTGSLPFTAHPLLRTLEAIRDADARVHEILLAPLRIDDVGRLVADALHCKPKRARPLAQLVHEKTGGNPFFAIQFFTALAEEGLLSFDADTAAWQWDIDRIRAKSYTDNVVDLMVGKLKRLSATTQEALKHFACLGNVAKVGTLALVQGGTEEAMHAALWEAVHAGLVFREDNAYKFLHDRIQQAAYTLILEEQRAGVHLRIGRVLLASMTADELAEHLFEVVNQFSRGAARLVDRDQKAQVVTINLRAGRKAKASAAYASACTYLAAGMALLDERDWGSQYDLMFSLRLERAECEFLTGNFETAEQLIGELLQRGASKVDQAAAYHLKVLLHTVKSENAQAVDSALTCLRLFGTGHGTSIVLSVPIPS
jgi:predicted ATPase